MTTGHDLSCNIEVGGPDARLAKDIRDDGYGVESEFLVYCNVLGRGIREGLF